MARSLLVKTVAGDSFHIDVAEKALVSQGQRVDCIPTLELKIAQPDLRDSGAATRRSFR